MFSRYVEQVIFSLEDAYDIRHTGVLSEPCRWSP